MPREDVLFLLTSNEHYVQEFLDNLARPERIEAQFTYKRKRFSERAWKKLASLNPGTALIVFVDAPPRSSEPSKQNECRFIPVRWVTGLSFHQEFGPQKAPQGRFADDGDEVIGLSGLLGPMFQVTNADLERLSGMLFRSWIEDGRFVDVGPMDLVDWESIGQRHVWRQLAPLLASARLLENALLFHVEGIREIPDPDEPEVGGDRVPVYRSQGYRLKSSRTYELSLLSYRQEKRTKNDALADKSAKPTAPEVSDPPSEVHINPVGPGLVLSQPFHQAIGNYKQEALVVEAIRTWDRKITTLVVGRDRTKPSGGLLAHISLIIEIERHRSDIAIGGAIGGAALTAIGQWQHVAILTGVGTALAGIMVWLNTRTSK